MVLGCSTTAAHPQSCHNGPGFQALRHTSWQLEALRASSSSSSRSHPHRLSTAVAGNTGTLLQPTPAARSSSSCMGTWHSCTCLVQVTAAGHRRGLGEPPLMLLPGGFTTSWSLLQEGWVGPPNQPPPSTPSGCVHQRPPEPCLFAEHQRTCWRELDSSGAAAVTLRLVGLNQLCLCYPDCCNALQHGLTVHLQHMVAWPHT